MTEIISLGKLSWYLIFPFILSICCFFQGAISVYLRQLLQDNNPTFMSTFIFVSNCINVLSLLFSGILAEMFNK